MTRFSVKKACARLRRACAALRAAWARFAAENRLRTIFWPLDRVQRDYGKSDVQANYSRYYVWSANQLGHIALGLLTALAFAWLTDAAQAALSWSGAHAALSGAVLALLIGPAALLIWRSLPQSAPASAEDRGEDAAPIFLKLLWGVALLAVLITVVWLLRTERGGDGERLAGPAAAVAGLYALAVSLRLCRQPLILLIGVLGWAGAVLVAQPYAIDADGALTGASDLAALAVAAAVAILSLVAWWRSGEVAIPLLVTLLAFSVAVAVFALSDAAEAAGSEASAPRLAALNDVRLALAGLVAATTLWWLKEFGNDLQAVRDELDQAAANRNRAAGAPAPSMAAARARYADDAKHDARADAVFYFGGALVAAGVLSPLSLFLTASFAAQVEIAAALIASAIFLYVGYPWMRRQEAIDGVGAPRAGRLGVYPGAVRLWTKRRGAAMAAVDAPFEALDRFATAPFDGSGERPAFHHLILTGSHADGRLHLALGLACEAALAALPPFPFPHALYHRTRRRDDRVKARYLRLSTFLESNEEIDALDTRQFNKASESCFVVIDDVDADFTPLIDALRQTAPEDGAPRAATPPLTLDEVGFADETRRLRSRAVRRAVDKLALDTRDEVRTVWVVGVSREEAARAIGGGRPPARARLIAHALRRALQYALGERGRDATIGVCLAHGAHVAPSP